ncbi:MAG: helix-turn-helix transcriptional regulator [Clostridia bacterium]|nr:helix-turn-helix transcriptional regulator [Clostridia bacterium]MDD4049301.1 helix-turn-helix transcriptional regulator [Clostridia bacterium]
MNKIENVITRIKQLREKNHLSQKEFGEIIGFSQGNIGDWERGRSLPSIKAIISIVNKFNVTPNWLLLGKETSSQDPFPLLKNLNQNELDTLNIFINFLLFKHEEEKKKQSHMDCSQFNQEIVSKLTGKGFFNHKSGN